jgi:prepilin-type N-terminal cleavage/methylation domain-containing protein
MQKGFTIIELIVVIAIISVLASIVMTNVTKYTTTSKEVAIQANMSSLATSAMVFFEAHGGYGSFCEGGSPSVENIFGQISAMAGKGYNCKQNDSTILNACCHDEASEWAACVQLTSDSTKAWCIDSTGIKREISNANCRTSKINSGCPAN